MGEVGWRGTQGYVCLTKLNYFSVLRQPRRCMRNINTAECVQRSVMFHKRVLELGGGEGA